MQAPLTAFVFGTRPEIIKLSPVIRLFHRLQRPFCLVHTGQHYSYHMDRVFFEELGLPEPKWKFSRPADLGANKHSELTNLIETNVLSALEQERPANVLVQGDTDSVVAGARAAKKLGGIRIGHVEAGLRSYDPQMPEERNRIETDRLSDFLFAPTDKARQILIGERFDESRIIVTGNTIVDALYENAQRAEEHLLADGRKKGHILVTLHRPESVDSAERLRAVIEALRQIRTILDRPIIFPVHPRTENRLAEFGISLASLRSEGIATPQPMGFLEFIWHEKNAALILTDSGGVQEEACVLKVPCVTVRTTTERPETVEVGANVVAGYETRTLIAESLRMHAVNRAWPNPFGDGQASQRILRTLEEGA